LTAILLAVFLDGKLSFPGKVLQLLHLGLAAHRLDGFFQKSLGLCRIPGLQPVTHRAEKTTNHQTMPDRSHRKLLNEGRGNVVSPKVPFGEASRKRFLDLGIVLDPHTSI